MKICLGIPSWNRLSVLGDYLDDLTELGSILAPDVSLVVYVYLQENEKKKASAFIKRYPHVHFGVVDAYSLKVKHGKIIQDAQFWFLDMARKELPDVYIWSDDDIRVKSSSELGKKLKGVFRHFLKQPKVGAAAISEFPSRQTSKLSFVSTETDKTIPTKNQVWGLMKPAVFEDDRLLNDPLFEVFDVGEDSYLTLKVMALGYYYGEYTGLLDVMYVPDVSEGDEGGYIKRIKGYETVEHSERMVFACQVGVSPLNMYANIGRSDGLFQPLNPGYDFENDLTLDPENNILVEKVAVSYWQQPEKYPCTIGANENAKVKVIQW